MSGAGKERGAVVSLAGEYGCGGFGEALAAGGGDAAVTGGGGDDASGGGLRDGRCVVLGVPTVAQDRVRDAAGLEDLLRGAYSGAMARVVRSARSTEV